MSNTNSSEFTQLKSQVISDLKEDLHNFDILQQEAIAIAFETELKRLDSPECYFHSLPIELKSKRDFMANFLKSVGMKPIIPQGGYFMIADWSALGKKSFNQSWDMFDFYYTPFIRRE